MSKGWTWVTSTDDDIYFEFHWIPFIGGVSIISSETVYYNEYSEDGQRCMSKSKELNRYNESFHHMDGFIPTIHWIIKENEWMIPYMSKHFQP